MRRLRNGACSARGACGSRSSCNSAGGASSSSGSRRRRQHLGAALPLWPWQRQWLPALLPQPPSMPRKWRRQWPLCAWPLVSARQARPKRNAEGRPRAGQCQRQHDQPMRIPTARRLSLTPTLSLKWPTLVAATASPAVLALSIAPAGAPPLYQPALRALLRWALHHGCPLRPATRCRRSRWSFRAGTAATRMTSRP